MCITYVPYPQDAYVEQATQLTSKWIEMIEEQIEERKGNILNWT